MATASLKRQIVCIRVLWRSYQFFYQTNRSVIYKSIVVWWTNNLDEYHKRQLPRIQLFHTSSQNNINLIDSIYVQLQALHGKSSCGWSQLRKMSIMYDRSMDYIHYGERKFLWSQVHFSQDEITWNADDRYLPTPELLLRKRESKDIITKNKDRADVWLGYSKTILSTYRRKDRGALKWLCLACIRLQHSQPIFYVYNPRIHLLIDYLSANFSDWTSF